MATKTIDTRQSIRCPRCRNRMDKKLVNGQRSFNLDHCKNCCYVWLDAGELAEIQLAFEARESTSELNDMRSRLRNMTDEERREYQARIDKLVDHGEPILEAVKQATIELTAWYYFRSFWIWW